MSTLSRVIRAMRASTRSSAALRPQAGQALVHMTLIITTFFGIVGGGIDWGRLIIEDTRIQAAADAAALAGARSLITGVNPGTASATTAANNYLSAHGYVHGTSGTTVSISFSSSLGTSFMDTISVTVNRTLDAYFWKLMGIQNLPVEGRAVARPGAATVDVMLSLDLTGSMESSGTNDMTQLRNAVVDFINQINPDSTNTFGPKVGIARWAGIYCSWNRVGDGDSKVDLSGTSEYVTPCYDDKTVLSNLTYDKSTLLKIANNSGGATCPAGVSPYGCPLDAVERYPNQANGTPVNPTNYECYGGWWWGYYNCGNLPAHTGTKMPNGISVVYNTALGHNAWHTSNGGRNGQGSDPIARKVLVMMTDGVNEAPSNPDGQTASTWATDVVTLANTAKLGPDGVAGTTDDVEIYVIGFFCTPYSASGTGIPDRWCKSAMADTALPHPCPSATWNAAAASTTDTLLKNISSSTAGSCDRYYPIKKTESLPQLFLNIAGSIQRGRLST